MKTLNFKTDLLPFAIATVGEFIALFYWIKFTEQSSFLVANVLLWIGFMIERISVVLWLRKVYRPKEGIAARKIPFWQIISGLFLITISEVIIWFIWIWSANQYGHIVAAIILFVLMLFEHSWELSLVKRTRPFQYITRPKTILFTVMEVIGAVAWLFLLREGHDTLGALALFVGLSVEHVIQGVELKPDVVIEEPAEDIILSGTDVR